MDEIDQDYPAHERAAKPRDPISLAVQDGIGVQLRAMYRTLEAEPLLDHLLDLLKRLDEPRSDEVS
jgi:hypothetical protein